jgi:hypothetical protein
MYSSLVEENIENDENDIGPLPFVEGSTNSIPNIKNDNKIIIGSFDAEGGGEYGYDSGDDDEDSEGEGEDAELIEITEETNLLQEQSSGPSESNSGRSQKSFTDSFKDFLHMTLTKFKTFLRTVFSNENTNRIKNLYGEVSIYIQKKFNVGGYRYEASSETVHEDPFH